MSSKPLLLLAVAAALTPTIIFSILITVNQVSILPNRPDTTYIFGRDTSSGAQIERIQLNLAGNTVVTVTITYWMPTNARYQKQVGLYDSSGNLIAIGSDCRQESGSRTRTINTVPDISVDDVATVKACIIRVTSCVGPPSCL
ncbi:MAG: hypothetical protein QXS96_05190 [Candidatus Caldarchaeum sp.]|uniref:Uncharacterized protein n=1 Tax=Caldiarchaeum subterraneum TaxID=311458 RepID=A0A7J3G3T0_CALS0